MEWPTIRGRESALLSGMHVLGEGEINLSANLREPSNHITAAAAPPAADATLHISIGAANSDAAVSI